MIEAMPKPAMPAASTPRARGVRAIAERGQHPDGQDDPPQGRVPRRAPAEDHERPGDGGQDGCGQGQAGKDLPPPEPQGGGAHADQGADGRRQGHRVVGVDDPLGEAEDAAGQEQPATEEEERRPYPIGPRGTPGHPQDGDQPDQGAGDEPRDLAAHRLEEQAVPPGRTPHAPGPDHDRRRCPSRSRSAGRSRCSRRSG